MLRRRPPCKLPIFCADASARSTKGLGGAGASVLDPAYPELEIIISAHVAQSQRKQSSYYLERIL
jgi:hypothetical protein